MHDKLTRILAKRIGELARCTCDTGQLYQLVEAAVLLRGDPVRPIGFRHEEVEPEPEAEERPEE